MVIRRLGQLITPHVQSLATTVKDHKRSIAVAYSAAMQEQEKYKPRSPIGKRLHENRAAVNKLCSLPQSEVVTIGWHATNLHAHDIEKQILRGVFERRGQNIYFGNENVAAHFGQTKSGAENAKHVIVRIYTHAHAVTDEAYGTKFIPPGDHDVHILYVHEICPEYLREIANPSQRPTFRDQLSAMAKASSRAYQEAHKFKP